MSNTVSDEFFTRTESAAIKLSPSSPLSFKDTTLTIEDSSDHPKKNFCFLAISTIWGITKCTIFMACATFFTYQASAFYKHYYTYPLTTNIAVTKPKYYKMPAVTFCNRNLIKRTYFCGHYPDLCSQPNNVKEFCEKHPYMCEGDVSKLVIPMFGYYTNTSKDTIKKIKKILQQLVFTTTDHGFDYSPYRGFGIFWEETYVMDTAMLPYTRCYSYNLRVFSKENQTTNSLVMKTKTGSVSETIRQKKEETLYPWSESQVFLSVHSPFRPENAIEYGRVLKTGFSYGIIVRLEEEHLLPAPYSTNCTDYEALWFQNNKTGARSFDMCLELCSWNFSKETYGCEYRLTMFHKWENICQEVDPYVWGDFSVFVDCLNNCKPDCMKLKYIYTITETPIEPSDKRHSL
ncbi:unnamed protein product [Larinioides sclopetarius]|uniref:Uncharacterized protein n=1 Tax=Larinioides sclopetarius TaxID=280406 RepID=A0AAV2BNI0_9ARAC